MDIAGKLPEKLTHEPLGLALLGAFALHAILILGVSFEILRENPPAPERTLDITLVPPRKEPEPVEKPDFLAPSSQQGAGDKVIKQRPSNPLGNPQATRKSKPAPELERAGSVTPEPKAQQVITQRVAPVKQLVRPPAPKVEAPPKPRLAQLLASTQLEIDRLTAEIDRRSQAASKRDRRKAINASTQEYRYAAYLEAWRKKVERIGNLNYPDEAKRKKLYGALLLHVSVRADGSVEQIRVVGKGSGHQVLDDAAKRIVRLAAPFAPFPPNIREEVDVLDITRTWQFRSGNRLFAN